MFTYARFLKTSNNPLALKLVKDYNKRHHLTSKSGLKRLPFYEGYLSKFNMDVDVLWNKECKLTKSDRDLLLRLIFACYSKDYRMVLSPSWKEKSTGKIQARIITTVRPVHETIKMKDIEKLKCREYIRCDQYGTDKINTMMKDITKNGIQKPIEICFDTDSDIYPIEDGNLRFLAAKQLGLKTVPTVIVKATRALDSYSTLYLERLFNVLLYEQIYMHDLTNDGVFVANYQDAMEQNIKKFQHLLRMLHIEANGYRFISQLDNA